MTKTIYILTKNKGKLLAAKETFSRYGIKIKMLDKEYPEIQADTCLEIAKHTAITAAKEFNVPVVREDHSLYINELGFPGPYTKYIESRLPAEKLITLIKKDWTGYFEVATVYAKPDGFTKDFVFQVPITISKEIKGNRGNWDKILMLEGSNKTFAESTEEENINIWNKNFIEIAKYLSNQNENE